MNTGIAVGATIMGFPLGFSLQSVAENWVEAPIEGYHKPKCPPNHAPKFFGVTVDSMGVSSPIYQCLSGHVEGVGVSWGDLQSEAQQPG